MANYNDTRSLDPAPGGGMPRNLYTTNNASDWRGPSYQTQWDGGASGVNTGEHGGSVVSGRLQYDPTTGQYTWLGPMEDLTGGQTSGSDSPGGGGIPNWAKAAAVAAPAVANRALNGGSQLSPEIQQLLALAMKRIQDQEPLFQAVNKQAMAGLPTAYQR